MSARDDYPAIARLADGDRTAINQARHEWARIKAELVGHGTPLGAPHHRTLERLLGMEQYREAGF